MDKFLKISPIINLGLVGLVAGLFIWIINLKDAQQVQAGKIYGLQWLLDAKEKENDILRDFGEYAILDTIWDSIPVPYPYAVHDTLPPDTFYAAIPRIWGHFKIDTVVGLGLKANPLYVRVKGRVYYPEEYYGLNWLKVYQDSLDSWKPPMMPLTARSRDKWGLSINYSRALRDGSGMDYVGLSSRYKRLSLAGSYDPWRKGYLGTISYELFTF